MADKGKSIMSEFQPSMTEWLASIGEEKESAIFRQEDNTKDERLELLRQTTGLEYDRPTVFAARDLVDQSPAFMAFLDEHGDELCALRLVPYNPDMPKLRNRGLTIRSVYEDWFPTQKINPDDYQASFRPHAVIYDWSIIFVINEQGIFGEMLTGQHAQLTHGDTLSVPTRFRTDLATWEWDNERPGAKEMLMRALVQLRAGPAEAEALRQELGAEFFRDYLTGYYESILWPDNVMRFGDYNRILHKKIPFPPPFAKSAGGIQGAVAYKGKVVGRVRLVTPDTLDAPFEAGDILVADNTDIRFVPLMQKAAAIVTDRGGMLSHASIVARELKKPCVVGAKNATQVLKDGDTVEVDADTGVVRIVERK